MGGGGVPDPTALVNLFQRPDLIGVFVFFLVALVRGWLVLGREYEKLEKDLVERTHERDQWMELALGSQGLAKRVTTVAERFGQQGGGYGGQPPQGYGPTGGVPQMPPQGYGPQRPPQGPQSTPPGYPPQSEQPT